jgi:hypothetical protein
MSIQPGSRYEDAERHSVTKHFYDAWGHPLLEDQSGTIRFMTTTAEATYLMTALPLPPPPPAEYYAKDWEHFPFIAYKFMDDSTRWWEVAEVNPKIWYPLDLTVGAYLRIPS